MNIVDLHTHTTYSDGTYTPKELIEYGANKNISAIAITDHDVLGGIEEGKYYGNKLGIEVISGIEVSTEYQGREIHIVGLFVDEYNKDINSKLNSLRKRRTERNYEMIESLNSLGLNISYDDVEKTAKGGVVTRAHFAKALKEKGYILSIGEAFDRYIGDGKPAYVKREVLPWQDTLNMITNSGGVPVLAHPLLYNFSSYRLEEMVSDMAKYGLKAIEAYYSTHSQSDVKYIKTIAQKNGLKISGGSDFHGANKPKLDLATGYGSLEVPYEVLEGLKEVK